MGKKRDMEAIGITVALPAGTPALHAGQGEPTDGAGTGLFLASDLGQHVWGEAVPRDRAADTGALLLSSTRRAKDREARDDAEISPGDRGAAGL